MILLKININTIMAICLWKRNWTYKKLANISLLLFLNLSNLIELFCISKNNTKISFLFFQNKFQLQIIFLNKYKVIRKLIWYCLHLKRKLINKMVKYTLIKISMPGRALSIRKKKKNQLALLFNLCKIILIYKEIIFKWDSWIWTR